MKPGPSVNSSDLERARGLARRLAGTAGTAPQRAAAPAYARFVADGTGAPPPAAPSSWERQLAWCRQAAGVAGLLVVDRDGLVVARAGDWSARDVESVAARLVTALEQAELTAASLGPAPPAATPGSAVEDNAAPCVCIESGGGVLTGLRVTTSDTTFVVGLLGPARVAPATRALVVERIRAAASARATDTHAA